MLSRSEGCRLALDLPIRTAPADGLRTAPSDLVAAFEGTGGRTWVFTDSEVNA